MGLRVLEIVKATSKKPMPDKTSLCYLSYKAYQVPRKYPEGFHSKILFFQQFLWCWASPHPTGCRIFVITPSIPVPFLAICGYVFLLLPDLSQIQEDWTARTKRPFDWIGSLLARSLRCPKSVFWYPSFLGKTYPTDNVLSLKLYQPTEIYIEISTLKADFQLSKFSFLCHFMGPKVQGVREKCNGTWWNTLKILPLNTPPFSSVSNMMIVIIIR